MFLSERFKKFPIKFYQNIKSNNIEYESGFTSGTSDSLNTAFKIFDTDEFIHDLYYYYDDVSDVHIGRFIPSLDDKIRRGRKYLGMLEVELDIENFNGNKERTVTYLNKNRDKIPAHLEYIQNMKNPKKEEEPNNLLRNMLNKLLRYLKREKVDEMFTPFKAINQLVCKHCGKVIQLGTYYDTYRGQDFHIECIWDKLINNMPENSYQDAEKFFFSLEEYIGNWPAYGYDVEEDYLSDLELVKHNNRILKRQPFTESARMINKTFEYYEGK